MRKFEQRSFNWFGAQDDFRSIVQRRLVALAYMMNDQGAVVDDSGNIIVDASDTSGSGQTPAELLALGYTPEQIASIAGSYGGPLTGGGPSGLPTPAPGGGGATTGGSSGFGTSFLTGLLNLGGQIAGIVRGPQPVVNPRTGQPYTQQQLQQLAGSQPTSVMGLNLGGALPLLLVGTLIYLVVRK